MKKLFLFVAALSVCALAAESSLDERVDGLTAQIDRVMSKAGIHFNGEFRSQFLSSTLDDGSAVSEVGKKSESAEYTSVDFNVVARPNTALSARAMFRLHQDWRNFFSDVQNPITSRWLSVDGTVAQGIFKYNAGDYRKKLTPLTLWSPDVELLYEPEIFAQGRELAMSEKFLGENNRVLQGANLELRAELGTEFSTILEELEMDVFGARLATRGTGESAPIAPGIATDANGSYWDPSAPFDKYLVGVNLSTQIIKGVGLGVSNISIFDNTETYRIDNYNGNVDAFEDSAKFHSVSNNIFAGRLNFDNRAFMSDDFVRFGISGEAAFSSYKRHDDYDTTKLQKTDGEGDSLVLTVSDRSIDGMAINAGLFVKFNFDEANTLGLSADYIMNDSAFINEAAQSPSFLQMSILNNEIWNSPNDKSGRLGAKNPFDAMYRSVFKYTPSQYFAESRPYSKNAYTNYIFPAGKKGVSNLPANVFQAALPGGNATADRTGPVIKLDGSFLDDALKVGARVASLAGMGTNVYKYDVLDENGDLAGYQNSADIASEYSVAGGGAIVDIAKFVPAIGPSLKIGGTFMMYNNTTGVNIVGSVLNAEKQKSESQLISVELVYNFVPRFSFLAGYQLLTATISKERFGRSGNIPDEEYAFDNLGVGFNYKVADGGALTVKLTMLSGEGTGIDGKPETLKYSAMQPEVYLTVKF